MGATIPVKKFYEWLDVMYTEKWGYIWGKAGILWTEEKQRDIEARYSEDDPKYGKAVKYGRKWIGHMVTDCSGVLVCIGNKFGVKYPHGSSSMVRDGYIYDCGSVPHPGWAALVDPTPETYDNTHIGYVGADGKTVYEAKGTIDGFVKSKVTDKKWTKFGKIKYIDYSNEEAVEPMPNEDMYIAEITGNNVRLRSGPGTNYKKVTEQNLFKGDKVEVQADCDNWKFVKVLATQAEGYVYSQYVSNPINVEPEKKEEDKPEMVGEYIMVPVETVNRLTEFATYILSEFATVTSVIGGDADGKVSS